MRIPAKAVLAAIKPSKGDFETAKGSSVAYDNTTFHLSVDLGNDSTECIGMVTRPFKFGTSAEYQKWVHLKPNWPVGGIQVDCVFDIVAGADNSSKLTLVDIRPVKG